MKLEYNFVEAGFTIQFMRVIFIEEPAAKSDGISLKVILADNPGTVSL